MKIYLVTFQFNHLGKNGIAALEIMRKEIERFYVVLLSDVVRRPRRLSHLVKLPRLIAIPIDRPASASVTIVYQIFDPTTGCIFTRLSQFRKFRGCG